MNKRLKCIIVILLLLMCSMGVMSGCSSVVTSAPRPTMIDEKEVQITEDRNLLEGAWKKTGEETEIRMTFSGGKVTMEAARDGEVYISNHPYEIYEPGYLVMNYSGESQEEMEYVVSDNELHLISDAGEAIYKRAVEKGTENNE